MDFSLTKCAQDRMLMFLAIKVSFRFAREEIGINRLHTVLAV